MTKNNFGCWQSPIDAKNVFSKKDYKGFVRIDNKKIYWQQKIDDKIQIIKRENGKNTSLLPKRYSARTKVHEYGGCSFTVDHDEVYFVNQDDQQIYLIKDNQVKPITISSKPLCRYADIVVDRKRKCLFCVRERHEKKAVINEIVKIDFIQGDKIDVVEQGYDFYTSLALDHKQCLLVYLCWNLPHMPWHQTCLVVARLDDDGCFAQKTQIINKNNVSVCQPKWGLDNELYFCCDETGWYNPYQYKDKKFINLYPKKEEVGYPDWLLGFSLYCFIYDITGYKFVCSVTKEAVSKLVIIDIKTKEYKIIDTPYNYFDSLCHHHNKKIVMIAASATSLPSIVILDLDKGSHEIISHQEGSIINQKNISVAKKVLCRTSDTQRTYGFYYPPTNEKYTREKHTPPPLIVMCHGGPTGYSNQTLDYEKQFFTSRGFALLDVNYRGSAGFGRHYRDALNGQWGIMDVKDIIELTQSICDDGKADADKLIIRGKSAGGYSILMALTFHDLFKAGASYFGISDFVTFVQDTHKFESKYVDVLIGSYPEKSKLYKERSPINFVDKLSCPVLFLQGDEDKVVPPSQSEIMYEALKKKKIPTAYLLLHGEAHGFRQNKNCIKALENELYFYRKIFNIPQNENISEIKIDNL